MRGNDGGVGGDVLRMRRTEKWILVMSLHARPFLTLLFPHRPSTLLCPFLSGIFFASPVPSQKHTQADPADDDTMDATGAAGGDHTATDEQQDHQEEEAAFKRDLELERAGTTFSNAKDADKTAGMEDDEEEDEEEEEEDSASEEGGGKEEEGHEVAPAVEAKQTEAQEHHELSKVCLRSNVRYFLEFSLFVAAQCP